MFIYTKGMNIFEGRPKQNELFVGEHQIDAKPSLALKTGMNPGSQNPNPPK